MEMSELLKAWTFETREIEASSSARPVLVSSEKVRVLSGSTGFCEFCPSGVFMPRASLYPVETYFAEAASCPGTQHCFP